MWSSILNITSLVIPGIDISYIHVPIRQFKILGKRVSRKQSLFVPSRVRNIGVISVSHMGLRMVSLENVVLFCMLLFYGQSTFLTLKIFILKFGSFHIPKKNIHFSDKISKERIFYFFITKIYSYLSIYIGSR